MDTAQKETYEECLEKEYSALYEKREDMRNRATSGMREKLPTFVKPLAFLEGRSFKCEECNYYAGHRPFLLVDHICDSNRNSDPLDNAYTIREWWFNKRLKWAFKSPIWIPFVDMVHVLLITVAVFWVYSVV